MPTESKPIQLGISCPDFELKGTDDKSHSLRSYSSSKVLVVGFTCNHCPYVKAYEDRINALAKNYQGREVSIVCINSNDAVNYPEDSFDAMKSRAREKGFVFDYLHDETQAIAKAFNAACTPEFYVFDPERKLRYHGRLDDNTHEAQNVKEHFLQNAIESILNSSPIKVEKTHALGCSIKWKK